MESYKTIFQEIIYEKTIEKSKFIAHMLHISTEAEGKAYLQKIIKKHSLATHNCYAMIIDQCGNIQRFSDDGEPQGTAGMPMLEILKIKKIYQVIAVVTRYFGGIKLGANGLVRAYSGVLTEALANAEICQCIESHVLSIQVDYTNYVVLKNILMHFQAEILETIYEQSITIKIIMPTASVKKFLETSKNNLAGKMQYIVLEEGKFYPYKNNKN